MPSSSARGIHRTAGWTSLVVILAGVVVGVAATVRRGGRRGAQAWWCLTILLISHPRGYAGRRCGAITLNLRGGAGPLPELVDVVEAGDRVVVVMAPRPSDADPQPGRTANLATFRDGLVIEMAHYDDAAEALAALGPPN